MGAIKTNIRKVLAAFLCACLLVTYNPAVGSTGTAFADENGVETYSIEQDGHLSNIQDELNAAVGPDKSYDVDPSNGSQASTTVNVMTFDNRLETACGGSSTPMVATLAQLRAGTTGTEDVSNIWFEVTGGTPFTGANEDPYGAEWAVYDNNGLNQNITSWYKNTAGAITRTTEGNVTTYRFDLVKYANNASALSPFLAGQTYTFVGTFKDNAADPASASCAVKLYVAAQGQGTIVNPFKWGSIDPDSSNTELSGVHVEGMRADGTKLMGGKMLATDSVVQAMENIVASDTIKANPDQENFVLGDVLQLNTNPVQIPNVSGDLLIPPFVSTNMIVRLPIDAKYTTGSNAYKENDAIKVLWTGGGADDVKTVDAVVVKEGATAGSETWYAELVYPFSGSSNAMGQDESGWEALPGCFAIEYNTKKLPTSEQPGATAMYFSVTVADTVNGTVTPAGTSYWKIGSDTEKAKYGIQPMSGYELKSLTLTQTNGGSGTLDFVEIPTSDMGTLSKYKNLLTLTNYASKFPENSAWELKAEFEKKDDNGGGGGGGGIGDTPAEPDYHDVIVNAVMDDNSAVPSGAGVVLFYEEDGDSKMQPTGNTPSHSEKVHVQSTTPVNVSIITPAPVDGTYYKLSSITLKSGSTSEVQLLENPYQVPATPASVKPVEDIEVTVTFVKTNSGFVSEQPTYTVSAGVASDSTSKGDVSTPVPEIYGDNAAFGSNITFTGKTTDYYVDYVEVFLDGSTTPSIIDLNPQMQSSFVWQMPNYHANARVVGHFSDKNAPSIEVTLRVPGGNGSIVPLSGELSGSNVVLAYSGQNLPLNFVAADGYKLTDVTLKTGSDEAVSRFDDVVGTVWRFVPVDNRATELKNGPLKMVVTATFEKKDDGNGGGGGTGTDPEDPDNPTPPGPTDPNDPNDPSKKKIPQQVNVYVADASLNDAANTNLAYVFNPPSESGVDATAISVADYSNNRGVANGQKSIFDSAKYGGTYPLTLKGNTLPVADGKFEAYGIEKVLVVTYGYMTDADGNQVKKGLKWDLYNWNLPYFELANITANTDVIVYFAPVKPKDGSGTTNPFDPSNPVDPDPNGPGGGLVEKDFVNVTVTANAANMVTPGIGTTTPVLKGGQLPMKFVLENTTHKLQSAVATPENGDPKPLTGALNDAATAAGTKTVSYMLQSIMANTAVVATYDKKTTSSDPVSYAVNANVSAKYLDNVPVDAEQPCSVTVASGANYATTSYLVGDAAINLPEGSNVRFTLQRANNFKMQNAQFTWTTSGVYAYIVDATQSDGSVKHTVHFTSNADELIGKKAYKSGTDLYGTEGAPDESTAVWYVENLQCPITVAADYQKQANSTEPDTPVKPGDGEGEDLDPNDPNHPDNPNNPKNSWTITTKVGKGLGQIFTDSPNYSGSTTRVLKDSVTVANPLTISLVPENGFRIKDVHVSCSSDNPLIDFWTSVFGWINGKNDMLDKMKADAIANGYIKMKKVDQNFEVTVDFEPTSEEYDPNGPLANQVAVNVVYDPARGSVTPNEGLTIAKDGKQQFTASPVKVGDKFFSVIAVKVSVGNDTKTVQAIDKSSNLVRWGSVYYNMFVVDFSKLTWPNTGTMEAKPAVTVEVLFGDSPDTPGSGSVSPGTSDPENPGDPDDPSNPNNPNNPGTTAKKVTVNVVTDGTAQVGSNGIGALVSPRGQFTVVGDKDASGISYVEQVNVSPLSGYEVEKIETVRNGDSNDAASFRYMQELSENGKYFSVSAEPGGTEVITIYVKQKPLSERSYSVEIKTTGVQGSDAFVSPTGTVMLNETASQTLSINPSENVWVQRVTDQYTEDGGKTWHNVENGGVKWNRTGDDKTALKGITVSPVKVKGKVVDRRVTVTFQQSTGTNHTLTDKEKTNIQVQAIGTGAAYVTFDPAENQTGVWKGTKDTPVTYNYRYTLSDEAVSQGYAIYRVQVNGADLFSATDVSELAFEGEYAFTTNNMRDGDNSTNTLFVYVKQFKDNGSGNGGGSGTGTGDPNDPSNPSNPNDPNNPGTNPSNPLEPVEPEPDDAVTLEYGCGDGGTIVLKDVNDTSKAIGTKGMKSVQIGKDDLFTVVMTPDSKHVMSAVYLNNCIMREFNWVKPSDGRTAKIALEYTLEVDDPDMPARVFAVFKQGSNNTFKPWDAMQIGNNSFATDSKFRVEISPSIGVEALVEMVDDPAVAGDMLSMQEPVAPFMPDVSAADDDGYVLEYDTISKLSNGKNVRILVGPLIKWDKNDNGNSTLYALDQIEGLQDGYTVTEKPLSSRMLSSRSSLGADGDEVDEQADKQRYYTYYEINGKLPDSALSVQAEAGSSEEGEPEIPVVRLNLRELSLNDGLFPEYRIGDIEVPLGSVLVNASVTTTIGSGTITPVAVPGTFGTPWFGSDTTGPWIIPADTKIAFKVEPAEGFVLDSLSVNNTDAARWFDAQTNTLTLTPSGNMNIVARFVAEDSADAMRTVTIEVVNAYRANTPHGSTYPPPGVHPVKKGTPFSITFNPDQTPVRYVPYHIWISGDNIASYEGGLTPEQSSLILPASWNNQTIRVQYAPEGTTPSGADYLVQTGQNLLNQAGASLVKTGDNPWLPVIVLLLLLAGGAAFGAKRFLGASESASRVAKYSVTKRNVRRDEDDKE